MFQQRDGCHGSGWTCSKAKILGCIFSVCENDPPFYILAFGILNLLDV